MNDQEPQSIQPTVAPGPTDTRLELAYDAGEKALALQDVTLGNTRTRANYLLATAALFTSLSTGLGLIKTDPTKGAVLASWKALVLVGVVALLGGFVFYVLWPAKNWQFVPSAQIIMQLYNRGKDESSIRIHVTSALITGRLENDKKLKRRQRAFEAAVILLIAEIVLLVLFLTFWK